MQLGKILKDDQSYSSSSYFEISSEVNEILPSLDLVNSSHPLIGITYWNAIELVQVLI